MWTKLPDGERIRVCDHERLIERGLELKAVDEILRIFFLANVFILFCAELLLCQLIAVVAGQTSLQRETLTSSWNFEENLRIAHGCAFGKKEKDYHHRLKECNVSGKELRLSGSVPPELNLNRPRYG